MAERRFHICDTCTVILYMLFKCLLQRWFGVLFGYRFNSRHILSRLLGFILFSQIKIMKIKYRGCIDRFILVAGGQLLKNIHLAKLQMVISISLISEPDKKSVLVKIIVHDFFAKGNMPFIGNYQR